MRVPQHQFKLMVLSPFSRLISSLSHFLWSHLSGNYAGRGFVNIINVEYVRQSLFKLASLAMSYR
jgi:hypothetical protein